MGLALVDKDEAEAEGRRRVAMRDRLETARETAREDRRRALIAENGWIFALIAAWAWGDVKQRREGPLFRLEGGGFFYLFFPWRGSSLLLEVDVVWRGILILQVTEGLVQLGTAADQS